MGGSFNPAHEGHLHISRIALERLALDEVWWLVSPGNPLKPADDMAPFAERMASAAAVVDKTEPRITVSAIENELGTRYSVDTLDALKERFPGFRFVWIMGADNLIQAHRWKDWRRFFRTVPIAVFPRPSYCLRARKARAARRFADSVIADGRAAGLADMTPPAWVFPRARLHGASSTRLRKNKSK